MRKYSSGVVRQDFLAKSCIVGTQAGFAPDSASPKGTSAEDGSSAAVGDSTLATERSVSCRISGKRCFGLDRRRPPGLLLYGLFFRSVRLVVIAYWSLDLVASATWFAAAAARYAAARAASICGSEVVWGPSRLSCAVEPNSEYCEVASAVAV